MRRLEEWCFTTLQIGHLLYHSKSNNGQAGVGFLINRKCKDHIVRVNSVSPRVAELFLCITKRYKLKIVQVYAPDEDINNDETLRKPNHYTIVMGDFNAQIWKNNKPYGNGNGHVWARIEKRNSRNLGKMGNIKTGGRRWTWKSPNGVMKTEIDYILTNRPYIVAGVIVFNQVNTGSDHRLVMSNNKLDVDVERKNDDQ